MKPLLSTLGLAVLLSATGAIAQQGSSSSNPDRIQSTASSAQSKAQQTTPSAAADQSNPNGGSPSSLSPGRVTGETPTQVQTDLDKQLPAGDSVTASVADDGSLKLTGTVRSETDKARAEQIAKQATNKNIVNKIEVKSATNDTNAGANPK